MDLTGGLPWQQAILFYLISLWALIWKGLALWRASKQAQRNWFIVLLVLNTIGILEIIYLFRFSKKRLTLEELKSLVKSVFYSKPESK